MLSFRELWRKFTHQVVDYQIQYAQVPLNFISRMNATDCTGRTTDCSINMLTDNFWHIATFQTRKSIHIHFRWTVSQNQFSTCVTFP